MLNLLERFCVWFLVKRERTVIINATIEGRLEFKKNKAYIHNNDLPYDTFKSNGEHFVVPKGKFNITI